MSYIGLGGISILLIFNEMIISNGHSVIIILTDLPIEYSVIVVLTGLIIGYSVIADLTGLPIGYSVIVALKGLPIGYSIIVALTGLLIGYNIIVALTEQVSLAFNVNILPGFSNTCRKNDLSNAWGRTIKHFFLRSHRQQGVKGYNEVIG